MKRFGSLYEKIYDINNIRLAHSNARKGKSRYSEVKRVDANPEYYFLQIQNMLRDKTFKNAEYHVFKRMFGKKEREIFKLPYFPDRIIHHCIMQILEPVWNKVLIRDTYSSLKGRGIHDGLKRVRNALKKDSNKYCLKFDIQKFYPSVDHGILKQIIRKKIKCQDTLNLLDTIIDSTSGIPIGNYLSQYFGNLYLTYFDHWMKEEKGCSGYFRYCDDVVVLSDNKTVLHCLFKEIEIYLKVNLNLSIKKNWQVFPIAIRGIDFLGYRIFADYCLLRKSIATNFKKKVAFIKKNYLHMTSSQIVNGIMSYKGWMKWADTNNLFQKYINTPLIKIMLFSKEVL